MRTLTIAALLVLSACTFVSPKSYDDRLDEMDDDGDGYSVATGDCDDGDPARSPGSVEIWGDGVDANCDELNDYDEDQDGFDLDVDCDDADPSVYPGAADTWYDGQDTDCGGEDDYDQDGDGYVEPENGGLPTTNVPGSGALPARDCDDESDEVNPGSTDEWYDGVDTDCSGNDDFDKDGDGYVYDSYVGNLTQYVDDSGALPGGECDDESALVNPGAADAWYDGIDTDCGGEDDYDADFDGWVPNGYEGETTLYVEDSGALPDGDCDDGDDDVFPTATEAIGDGVDQDCDSGVDSFVLDALDADLTLTLSDALRPHLRFNDEQLFLGIAAASVEVVKGTDPSSTFTETVFVMALDLSNLHNDDDLEIYDFLGGTSNGPRVDFDFDVRDHLIVGGFGSIYSSTSSGLSGGMLRIGAYDMDLSVPYGKSGSLNGTTDGDAVAAYTQRITDSGQLQATVCMESGVAKNALVNIDDVVSLHVFDGVTYATIDELNATACTAKSTSGDDIGTLYLGRGGELEVAENDLLTGFLYTYDDDPELYNIETLSYDPTNIIATEDPFGETWLIFQDNDTGRIVAVDESRSVYVIKTALADGTRVDATFDSDGRLYVTYAVSGDVHVIYGTPLGGSLDGSNEVTLDPGFSATESAIWVGDATGDGIIDIAVAALSDDQVSLGTARLDPSE